jgi:ABC-2 type transport system permease protein
MYVILLAIFLGMSQLSAGGGLNIHQERMIIGYCLMQFIMSSQMGWSGQISNESQMGTLEQLSISGHRLGTVLLARGFSQFPRQTISFFILIYAYLLALPKLNLHFERFAIVVLFLFIIALGVYGIAYIFAGLTLLFKRVGFFFQIINFAFLGLFWQNRDSLAEGGLYATLYDAFPLTLGMKNLLYVFTAEKIDLALPLFHQIFFSGCFAVIGYLLFVVMEKKARQMALLSQY